MFWVIAESGTKFQAIDVPEWYDYDEKGQTSISVTGIELSISATK